MKNKIFEKMREYGWNLGDNTDKDFADVYNTHYNFIEGCYDYIADCDMNEPLNMNDISANGFEDMITFMSDFLRALNDINYSNNIKLDLIGSLIKNRNISSEQIGQDILGIINRDESSLEELADRTLEQIEYLNNKEKVCSFDKSDMYELDCLNYEYEQINKLLGE